MLAFTFTNEQIKDFAARCDTNKMINFTDEKVASFVNFAKAIWEDINTVQGNSMMLMMEHIAKLSVTHANFKPYDIMNPPGGFIDPMKLMQSSNEELVYERLTHVLAAEWKKFPVAV